SATEPTTTTAAAATTTASHLQSSRWRHRRFHREQPAMSRGRGSIIRSVILSSTSLIALVALGACSGADASKAATTTTAMLVGPENIAVVKAQEIRSGPAISGNLAPEEQANVRAEIGGIVLQTMVEQGRSVSKGQVLARID